MVVTEQAVSSMVGVIPLAGSLVSLADVVVTTPSQEPPDVAMVASEGPAQSVPPVAQTTVFDVGWTERGGSVAAPSEMRETSPPYPGVGGRLEAVSPRWLRAGV